MKTERRIAELKALLTRALSLNDSDLVKQYSWGLFFAQSDRIKELEKEIARRQLTERYAKKVSSF